MNFKTLALAAAVMALPLVTTGGAAVAGPIKTTKFKQRVVENPQHYGRRRVETQRTTKRTAIPGVRISIF